MFATPVSWSKICCVLTAILAANSVGKASVSSSALAWSEFVPPSTAASDWMATRATLLNGCWAVRVTPAVCEWKRSFRLSAFLAP